MFKYLRPGNASLLGDMTDEYHRNSRLLGKAQQHGCAFLYL